MKRTALVELVEAAAGGCVDFHIIDPRHTDVLAAKLDTEYEQIVGCDAAGHTVEDDATVLLRWLSEGRIDDLQGIQRAAKGRIQLSVWMRLDERLCLTHSWLVDRLKVSQDAAFLSSYADDLCALLRAVDGAVLAVTAGGDDPDREPEEWQDTLVLLRLRC